MGLRSTRRPADARMTQHQWHEGVPIGDDGRRAPPEDLFFAAGRAASTARAARFTSRVSARPAASMADRGRPAILAGPRAAAR